MLKLTNIKILFNVQYAYLQNSIKCIFDVIKQRFQIFNKILEYLQIIQIVIIYTIIRLHNFIKTYLKIEEDIYYIPINIYDNA